MFRALGLFLGLSLSVSATAVTSDMITVTKDAKDGHKFCVTKLNETDGKYAIADVRMVSDYKVQGWMWDEDITEDPFFYEMDESAVVGAVGGVVYKGLKYKKHPSLHLSVMKNDAKRVKQLNHLIRTAQKIDDPAATVDMVNGKGKNLVSKGRQISKKAGKVGLFTKSMKKADVISDFKVLQAHYLADGMEQSFRLSKKFMRFGAGGAAIGAVTAGILAAVHKTTQSADTQAMSTMTSEQIAALYEIASPAKPGFCGILERQR